MQTSRPSAKPAAPAPRLVDGLDDFRRERASLDDRRAHLQKQYASLRRHARHLQALRAKLRQKQEQIERTHRERLKRMEEFLESKARSIRHQARALEIQRGYARKVVDQRNAVMELRHLLAEAEQRMIHHWGIHHAIGLALRALVCLGVLMGLSYFAGAQLARQTWSVSAVVRHLDGETVPGNWAAAERDRLVDRATLDQAAVLLRQGGYHGPAQPLYLRRLLDAGLYAAAPAENVLHIELHGTSRDELLPVLAALIQAYTAPPASPDEGADQGLRFAAAPPRMLVEQEPQLAKLPVKDSRVQLTLILFVCSLGVTALLVVAVSRRMVRAGQRAELVSAPSPALADDNAWKAYQDALQRPAAPESRPLF